MRLWLLLVFLLLAPPAGACERIVTLAPSATEALFALGLGSKVVGVTRFDAFPAEVKEIPKVGGYLDPDFEAILRLRPTLVVVTQENEQVIAWLMRLKLPHVVVDQNRLAGVEASFLRLGERCQRQSEAQKLVQGLQADLARLRLTLAEKSRPKVLISMNRPLNEPIRELFIAGPGTYLDELITLAGGVNVYQGSLPYPILSREGILRLNPEVILDLVPERGTLPPAQALAPWEALTGLQAVANHRVHLVEADYFALPGPRIPLALADLTRYLHGARP